MFSIYHWKIFNLKLYFNEISVRLYHKGLQFSCNLLTGRNVMHLSLENDYLILFCTKISVRLYQKGWQFSGHLITGRNVKHLSQDNVKPHIVF